MQASAAANRLVSISSVGDRMGRHPNKGLLQPYGIRQTYLCFVLAKVRAKTLCARRPMPSLQG